MTYSSDLDDYEKKYEQFIGSVPEVVQNYFDCNWHGIKHEWVEGLNKVNFLTRTNNHLESFFPKSEIYCDTQNKPERFDHKISGIVKSLRNERQHAFTSMSFKVPTQKLSEVE